MTNDYQDLKEAPVHLFVDLNGSNGNVPNPRTYVVELTYDASGIDQKFLKENDVEFDNLGLQGYIERAFYHTTHITPEIGDDFQRLTNTKKGLADIFAVVGLIYTLEHTIERDEDKDETRHLSYPLKGTRTKIVNEALTQDAYVVTIETNDLAKLFDYLRSPRIIEPSSIEHILE